MFDDGLFSKRGEEAVRNPYGSFISRKRNGTAGPIIFALDDGPMMRDDGRS
jgi:hypothetical protein